MVETYESYDEYLQTLYKQYYENILKQMEEQGFSKVQIFTQRMMFEKREDLFDEFCDRYDFDRESEDEFEITFEPEDNNEDTDIE